MTTISLPLSRGLFTIISKEDAEVAELKWYASSSRNEHFYAARKMRKEVTYLHRIIMERILGRPLLKSEIVDHINGDTLVNTRDNLRLATRAQNQQNQKKSRANKSGYKGVHYAFQKGLWIAQIKVNQKRIHIGIFDTVEEAAAAYAEAAKKYHGEFANVK